LKKKINGKNLKLQTIFSMRNRSTHAFEIIRQFILMNTPVQELYLKLGSFDLTDALKFNTNIIHIEDHFLTPLYLHYIERNMELKKIKRAFDVSKKNF
jgi:hypothetical protein